jgi:hypothetical protein
MSRGSAPGERRGGRQKGTPNRATAEIKKIAGKHSKEAVEILIGIARQSESDAARVAAVKEILDRGHGKPTQPVSGDDTAPPIRMIERVIVDPANKNS